MKIVITGSPGVGKTAVGKELAKSLNLKYLNEKEFALEKGIGKWDTDENELVIPLKKLETEINSFLKKHENILIEGHLLCEIKLKSDFLIVLRLHPEILESRLELKGYKAEKIQDNVFCEGIDYCLKHAKRKYPKNKIIEVKSQKTIKDTSALIIRELKSRGDK
jgi:adenylate kinase